MNPLLRATLLVVSAAAVFAGYSAALSLPTPDGLSVQGITRRLAAFPALQAVGFASLLSFLLPSWFVGVSVLMAKSNEVAVSEVCGEHPGLAVALVGLFIPFIVFVIYPPHASPVAKLFIESPYTPYALVAVAHGIINAIHTTSVLPSRNGKRTAV